MKINSLGAFLLLGIMALSSCKVNDEISASTPDWTEASHGNSVSPDYDVAFPQDKVNTLEITMTSADWQTIKSDIKTKSGSDFGASSSGIGMPGGANPGGGGGGNAGGGGLDLITGDPIYVATSVKFNGKEWYHTGFRLKGNSSLSGAWRSGNYKLPFKLNFDEFEDTYPEIKNQRFYGFKEFSMSPGYNDNSLMRDKIASDLFKAAGIPSAQTAFYKVYINFGDGLKYCGVYTMVEVIDDTMIKNQFGEDDGNIYKPESALKTFVQDDFEKKNNKTAADYSDVQSFITALNASTRTSNASQWRSDLEKVFNVDHYLKVLAVNNVIVNWDAYGAMAHNYYLYTHSTKKITWIPWDFNLSMTTSSTGGQGGQGNNQQGVSLAMTEVTNAWPLIRYVADDATYYAKYKAYVKEFNDNIFTTANVNAMLDKNYTLIAPYVTGSEPEQKGYTYLSSASDFATAITALKTHVVTRNTAVKAFVK